jgi:hypothetical protein
MVISDGGSGSPVSVSVGVSVGVGVGVVVSAGVVVPVGVVSVGVVVTADVGSVVETGSGALGTTVAPAATAGDAVPTCALVDGPDAVVGRLDEVDREEAEDSATSPSLGAEAQPSPMPDRVCAWGSLPPSGAPVTVATDARLVSSAGAAGADETTTAVRTAAPKAALPAATVHQSRRGRRRTACRGLTGGLPTLPLPSRAPPPPGSSAMITPPSCNFVIPVGSAEGVRTAP